MALKIMESGKYDVMALGALVTRLDPGEVPFAEATDFKIHVSGAEYNVAANASKYGMKAAVLTGMGDYQMADLIRYRARAIGVDILGETFPHSAWDNHHAMVFSGDPRGCAPNDIDYTRSDEAGVKLVPGMLNYKEILEGGTRWVHSGGLYAALGKYCPDMIVEFFQEAKKQGAVVSFDLNYRRKLWAPQGGQDACITAMKKIMPYVDVLFGNESDMANALGLKSGAKSDNPFDPDPFNAMQSKARAAFSNLEIIITSLRDEVNDDTRIFPNEVHKWGAIANFGGDKTYQIPAKEIGVLDRIGGGDGLASGFVVGVLKGMPYEDALLAGWASGALVASYHGDITGATWKHVLNVAHGKVKKVQR